MTIPGTLGNKYGRLKIVAESDPITYKSGRKRAVVCQCECGNTTTVPLNSLRTGNTTSCGCGRGMLEHGRTDTSEYRTWAAMLSRCRDPKATGYYLYGARGVSVCHAWQHFENFYADMGNRPEGMSLDRIDNDGDYTPSNCRWATPTQQSRNMRANALVTFGGKTLCISEWAERLGIGRPTLQSRLRTGWSVEDAFTKPVRKYIAEEKKEDVD